MIISASRRTDIPCCFSEWFLNRLKAGFVLARNPFNFTQISRIPLSPEFVDCIVFWTKDAANMMPYLDTLDAMGYTYCFQFTLTPYGRDVERRLRDKDEIIVTFQSLSKRIGSGKMVWRYDPIIFDDLHDVEYHKEQFLRLCDRLHSCTERVVISYLDLYKKQRKGRFREAYPEEIAALSGFIGETAGAYGLSVSACCEKTDLRKYGITPAGCIDRTLLEKVCGVPLSVPSDRNQRSGCGCCESIDIGAYNTCGNGCLYCYATEEERAARYVCDPQSAILDGLDTGRCKITERKVISYSDMMRKKL